MKPVRNLLLPVLIILFFSCRKESFTESSSSFLRSSADSIHFDTVFTSTGSVSQAFTIINNHDKGIHISSVKLAGGASSPFKINVDGVAGPEVKNIDVYANDSIYIFTTVSIDPSSLQLPFIVRDSIEIDYNGNHKWVQLDAYGRNAHFLKNHTVGSTETWNNDLPYVILGHLTVDTNALLTINQGCKIYIHADAPFIVHGTLQVNGQKEDSSRIVFAGDRLDIPYKDYPASYPGLLFTEPSRNNVMSYAFVRNAYQGIVVTEPSPGTKLTLNQVVIDNAYDAGLIGIHTSISANNVLISNCGKDILLVKGGDYKFTHCTGVANSNNYIQHRDPVMIVTDYLNGATTSLNALFRNCIFWGDNNGLVPDEVVVQRQGTSGSVLFDHVLWRVQTNPAASITGAINNQYPLFDSTNTNFYRRYGLTESSPAKNAGVPTTVNTDLDGHTRPVGQPDLGAFEKQ
ncbi:MAG: choice-of-anchor Q domain-containing protein [Flavisolibacter sp.]